MSQPLTPRIAFFLTLPPLLWAGNAVVGRAMVGQVPPLALNAMRWWLALALLLPLAYMIVGSVAGLWGYSAWSDDVRAAISTAVVSLIIGGAAGYYWGAATGSRKAT